MQMKPLLKPLNEDEAASLEWLTQTAHERHERMQAYRALPLNADIPNAAMMQYFRDSEAEERYQHLIERSRSVARYLRAFGSDEKF